MKNRLFNSIKRTSLKQKNSFVENIVKKMRIKELLHNIERTLRKQEKNQSNLMKNGPKTLTGTLSEKIYR